MTSRPGPRTAVRCSKSICRNPRSNFGCTTLLDVNPRLSPQGRAFNFQLQGQSAEGQRGKARRNAKWWMAGSLLAMKNNCHSLRLRASARDSCDRGCFPRENGLAPDLGGHAEDNHHDGQNQKGKPVVSDPLPSGLHGFRFHQFNSFLSTFA